MKRISRTILTACLAVSAVVATAAPPTNPGSQRNERSLDRLPESARANVAQQALDRQEQAVDRREQAQERRDQAVDRREQAAERRTQATERRDFGQAQIQRSEESGRGREFGQAQRELRAANPGRPGATPGSTDETQRGSARSALVNKGQNQFGRINADKILANRLAQVERLRDIALENGDETLLTRADELEAAARADFSRRTGTPSDPGTDPSPEPEPIPDPTPTPDPDPTPDPEPIPDPTPTPDPTPEPDPSPEPEPTPEPEE